MDISSITNELYFSCMNDFVTKKIRITDAIQLITYCMELVDKQPVTGPQKSELVKNITQKLSFQYFDGLKENLSEDCINKLKLLNQNNLLQPIMDAIYNASKGRFDISNFNTTTTSRQYTIELNSWKAQIMGY